MSEHAVGAPTGKYVYGVVRANAGSRAGDFGEIGIGGARVYALPFGAVAAVVSDAGERAFEPTRELVLAHEFVNESVMRDQTVIPMAFGTVFRAAADVVALLRSTQDVLGEALDRMRDRIEVGVTVLWDRDRVAEALERDDDEVRTLRARIVRDDAGSTYFARARLRALLEAALEARGSALVAEVHDALRPAAVASRSSAVVGDRMILNAAFLLDRGQTADFDRRLEDVARHHEDVLSFRVTGPWPPYNFVNIKLRLEPSSDAA